MMLHDLEQSSQGLFGFASPAQDHEIVGVGHDRTIRSKHSPHAVSIGMACHQHGCSADVFYGTRDIASEIVQSLVRGVQTLQAARMVPVVKTFRTE